MKKNDTVTVKIEDVTNLGFGVAKPEGKVLFVSGTVTGDVARVKIIKLTSSYMVGKLIELIEASPIRLPDGSSRCSIESCQGCAYKLISYDDELRLKEDSVKAIFKKAGLDNIKTEPIVASPSSQYYRNKAQYPVSVDTRGNYLIGFYKPKSHTVCEAAACPLAPKEFPPILEELRSFFEKHKLTVYDEEKGTGLIRHIYLRRGQASGEILLTLVLTSKKLPASEELVARLTEKFPEIVGILINVNSKNTNVILGEEYITVYGRDYIVDTLSGVKLKLTAPSFYQVNHDAAELLYAKAKELANPQKSDTLLDLYCGAGSIGLSMAKEAGRIIGIEIVESAVECAEYNKKLNGIENAAFFTGDAADVHGLLTRAEASLGEKITPDVIILDPPRAGCAEELLKYVSTLNPQRIVYISCNPATLARDISILAQFGFTTDSVTPVDLFPGTGHVESVVRLERRLENELRERMN